jgi:hypothetical protein
LDEQTRKRQEICRAILGETEQNLRVVLQSKENPVLIPASVYATFEDQFWLLPSELSQSIRKIYFMISEANSLIGRTDSAAVFRRNDLWYTYMPTGLTKLQEEIRGYEALKLQPAARPFDEGKRAELVLLLRKMFDGITTLAIGRELHEAYCLQFNETGHDKDYKYYDEGLAANGVANSILNDEQLLTLCVTYKDKMRSFWDFSGKYYTYLAKTKELKLQGAWPSFERILEDLLTKHGKATYAVLRAYVELRKDYGIWSACDYNQLAYGAKELSGRGWRQALIGLEVEGVIEKRGSGKRPGERSIAPELIPLVQHVLSKWEKTQQEPSIKKSETIHPPPEAEKMIDTIWDVFVCHASEDKDAIARPLAETLRSKGLRVWYDEFTLTLGDSLSQSIDHGLAKSRFGVVILSPAFFKKQWPRKELDGLTAKEISSGKVILPIWHTVTREYVLQYSPILADKLAVSTDKGLEEVVDEILRAVGKARNTFTTTLEPTRSDKEMFDRQMADLP